MVLSGAEPWEKWGDIGQRVPAFSYKTNCSVDLVYR